MELLIFILDVWFIFFKFWIKLLGNQSNLQVKTWLIKHSIQITFRQRWTAPYILDRTLDYIPRLQAEIARLTLEKNKFLSLIGKQQQQQQQRALASDRDKQAVNKFKQTLNVSINEVKRGELIVQICQQKGKLDHIFSALIKKLEGEDIQIIGASSICISEDTSCFHLHVQVCQNPLEADYVADLQKKLIYWLS